MRIGMVSTRLAGTDGVSLEAAKMSHILREMGHIVVDCAGELDEGSPGRLIPTFHFEDPTAQELGNRAFAGDVPDPELLRAIGDQAQSLKVALQSFVDDERIDFLIQQNLLAIPMQLPLAQAITEFLAASGLPALAHNHDLYWERERFRRNRIPEFLDRHFPPRLPHLRHAVINSLAKEELRRRHAIDSTIIPNVFDFDVPAPGVDDYNADFRQAIGVAAEDWLVLQPTRVIPRKGIELAIDLLARLGDPRARLIITHRAGDEGMDYLTSLRALAAARGVDLRYVADQIEDRRGMGPGGTKLYSLWDAYVHADFVTYPSLIEGFGNALVETIYFRLPALVNRYDVYKADIGPIGFQLVEIDGAVTDEAVGAVAALRRDPEAVAAQVEHNFHLAAAHYGYGALRRLLEELIPRP